MDEVREVGLEDFIKRFNPKDIYENQIIVMEMTGDDLMHNANPDAFPIRLESYSAFLVCKGEARVTMDYISYILKQNMVMEKINMHLINNFQMSHDFAGYHIILSNELGKHLYKELLSLPKEYAVSKRHNPSIKLDHKEFSLLLDIVARLRNNMQRNDHFFQKTLIMNEVKNFILELFNFGIQRTNSSETIELSYLEDIVLRFAKLLTTKCKEWYEVSDYSTELCVTPVYLSRTIKSVIGKTAIECIHEARIGESKILLQNPNHAVQDVADMLHFSDQSAFGKFFKKHTGISPMEYKKNILTKQQNSHQNNL